MLTHETVRDGEARFAPLLADQLRTKRLGRIGKSCYADETSIKVQGKWRYLYRAIDHDGNLVDSRLSEKRDRDAATQVFKQAMAVVGHAPESVPTDGHRSSPRAVGETLGHEVVHLRNVSLNTRIEQDHRGIKQRSYPRHGCGIFASAARFCRAFDELRQFFRVRISREQKGSLAHKREVFRQQLDALQTLVSVAS